MRFDAIVHAPVLRAGIRVNIAAADQRIDAPPPRFEVGSVLRLRFGVCCPTLASGTIIALKDQPETAVLSVDGESWMMLRGSGGVTDPGLLSEDWFVAGSGADFAERPEAHATI